MGRARVQREHDRARVIGRNGMLHVRTAVCAPLADPCRCTAITLGSCSYRCVRATLRADLPCMLRGMG
eukprot:3873418-Prymnesium_polylepis.1